MIFQQLLFFYQQGYRVWIGFEPRHPSHCTSWLLLCWLTISLLWVFIIHNELGSIHSANLRYSAKNRILSWLVDNPIDTASRTACQRRTQQPRAAMARGWATQMHTKTAHSTLVNAQLRVRNQTKTCHKLVLATALGQHLVALHILSIAVPSTNHTKGPQSMHPDTGPPDRFCSKGIHILSVNPNQDCSVICLRKRITTIKGKIPLASKVQPLNSPCNKFQNLWALKLDTFSENITPERSNAAKNMAETFDIPFDLSEDQGLHQPRTERDTAQTRQWFPRQRPSKSSRENWPWHSGPRQQHNSKSPVNHRTQQNTLWIFRQSLIPLRIGDHHLDMHLASGAHPHSLKFISRKVCLK
jgi:hypothetical protein